MADTNANDEEALDMKPGLKRWRCKSPFPFALRCSFNLFLKLEKSWHLNLHPTVQILNSLNNYTNVHFRTMNKFLDQIVEELEILPRTGFCFKLCNQKTDCKLNKLTFLKKYENNFTLIYFIATFWIYVQVLYVFVTIIFSL